MYKYQIDIKNFLKKRSIEKKAAAGIKAQGGCVSTQEVSKVLARQLFIAGCSPDKAVEVAIVTAMQRIDPVIKDFENQFNFCYPVIDWALLRLGR